MRRSDTTNECEQDTGEVGNTYLSGESSRVNFSSKSRKLTWTTFGSRAGGWDLLANQTKRLLLVALPPLLFVCGHNTFGLIQKASFFQKQTQQHSLCYKGTVVPPRTSSCTLHFFLCGYTSNNYMCTHLLNGALKLPGRAPARVWRNREEEPRR